MSASCRAMLVAIASGSVMGFASHFADPGQVAFTKAGAALMLKVALVGAVGGLRLYLAESPVSTKEKQNG